MSTTTIIIITRGTATYRVSSHDLARPEVDADHVAGLHHSIVNTQRVDPHAILELRVSHADVTADALGVPFTSPDAKTGRHVLQLPLSLLGECVKGRDLGQGFAVLPVSESLQRCEFLLVVGCRRGCGSGLGCCLRRSRRRVLFVYRDRRHRFEV